MEKLDVTGLPPEDVTILKEFLEFLKNRRATPEPAKEPTYRTWPLGVKGPITRQEIYDELR